FASHLAKRLNATYLSSDELRKRQLSNPGYTTREKADIYSLLIKKASEALDSGKPVVMDATFHKAVRRENAETLAAEKSQPLYWIEVFADEDIIRERVSHKRENSDADYAVYRKIKAEAEPMEREHLRLKSTND